MLWSEHSEEGAVWLRMRRSPQNRVHFSFVANANECFQRKIEVTISQLVDFYSNITSTIRLVHVFCTIPAGLRSGRKNLFESFSGSKIVYSIMRDRVLFYSSGVFYFSTSFETFIRFVISCMFAYWLLWNCFYIFVVYLTKI